MKWYEDIRPMYGQDPYLFTINQDWQVLIQSEDEKRIVISNWKRPDIRTVVWDHPDECQVWAPEIHKNGDFYYILYSYSDGENHSHRNHVLVGTSLYGPYQRFRWGPDIWGIDATLFSLNNILYAAWSGWEANGDEFPQHLYIARWDSPEHRIKIASPEREWEGNILEGPQFCAETQRLYYSANCSWKTDYSTGFLQLCGAPLDPNDWAKYPIPVAQNFGHAQPIGNDQFIGHTKLSPLEGWQDRAIEIKTLRV